MALQSKTFTAGKSSWDDYNRGFVLTLKLTENSVSESANTSNISYELVLSNPERHYDFWYPFTAYVGLTLGGVDLSKNMSGFCIGRDLNGNKTDTYTQTLLSGSVDVPHSNDGKLIMSVTASFPDIAATGYAGPHSITINDTWSLTQINRVPSIVFNGTDVRNIVFNGQTVTHLIYNGKTIF